MPEATLNNPFLAEIRQLRDSVRELERREARQTETLREARHTIQQLKKRIAKLLAELKSFRDPEGMYDHKWSLVVKVIFVLRVVDMPLRAVDIARELGKLEPALLKLPNQDTYLSAALTRAMSHKLIVHYRMKAVIGHFYTLPEWIDRRGNDETAEKAPDETGQATISGL